MNSGNSINLRSKTKSLLWVRHCVENRSWSLYSEDLMLIFCTTLLCAFLDFRFSTLSICLLTILPHLPSLHSLNPFSLSVPFMFFAAFSLNSVKKKHTPSLYSLQGATWAWPDLTPADRDQVFPKQAIRHLTRTLAHAHTHCWCWK